MNNTKQMAPSKRQPDFQKRTLRTNLVYLSAVRKILEGIIRKEYMKFLVTNNLVATEQHGLVPIKSCITNLLEILDFILEPLSYEKNVGEILLELSKAFDLIHKLIHFLTRLIHKLKTYGGKNELS